MSELVALEVDRRQGVPVVHVSGEVDASNADDLRDAVLRSVSNQDRGLVVNLSETGYLDSSGIQLLFEAAERLRDRQLELRVVVPPDSFVADVLRVTRLEQRVGVDAALDDAVDALR
jgi:anti-sigma B factor antagonist